MRYFSSAPIPLLSPFIKSFWALENDHPVIKKEKIIPDGYPELIFHYGDPYKINISEQWKMQDTALIAGQIKNHFHLKNTGKSGVFGIKMQPTAIHELFHLDMNSIVDTVIPIPEELKKRFHTIFTIAISKLSFEEKVIQIQEWFSALILKSSTKQHAVSEIVQAIIQTKGKLTLDELSSKSSFSKRSIERYFKKAVGLSPKHYIRIIRFSQIFHHVQAHKNDWSDIAYLCGYYDQSHFIKNFKEFTGERPSNYGFDEKNMANFFLLPS